MLLPQLYYSGARITVESVPMMGMPTNHRSTGRGRPKVCRIVTLWFTSVPPKHTKRVFTSHREINLPWAEDTIAQNNRAEAKLSLVHAARQSCTMAFRLRPYGFPSISIVYAVVRPLRHDTQQIKLSLHSGRLYVSQREIKTRRGRGTAQF